MTAYAQSRLETWETEVAPPSASEASFKITTPPQANAKRDRPVEIPTDDPDDSRSDEEDPYNADSHSPLSKRAAASAPERPQHVQSRP